MKRDQRLTESLRFQQVRRAGNCSADAFLVVCVLPNGLAMSRFGFSVSKRVGRAVLRNRVRRRVREAVRLRLTDIAAGYDVVFVARLPVAHASYSQIEGSVDRLLRLTGLIIVES